MSSYVFMNITLSSFYDKHTLRNTTLQARVERIAREERDQPRWGIEGRITAIIVTQCLEACNSSDGLLRTRFYVIHIIVMQ